MPANALFGLAKDTFSEYNEDKVARLAAALAYYTVFSLAPLLVVVLAIVGFIFGDEAARGQLFGQIRGLVGDTGAAAVEDIVEGASQPSTGIVATIIGVATLLFGAGGVFGQLQDALNTIWEVAPKPGRGILGMLKDRFLSFTMVLGVAFLLLVSLVLSTAVSGVGGMAADLLPTHPVVLEIVNSVFSFAVITLLFAAIFKILPDAKIAWRDVWLGAAVTAALFTIGKFALGYYLGRGSTTSSFGAAASLVVLLLWVYYSAQILFIGAEFTQVYAKRFGSRIVPSDDAVALTDEAKAQQGIPPKEKVNEAARPPRPVEPIPQTAPGEVSVGKAAGGLAALVVVLAGGWLLNRKDETR